MIVALVGNDNPLIFNIALEALVLNELLHDLFGLASRADLIRCECYRVSRYFEYL